MSKLLFQSGLQSRKCSILGQGERERRRINHCLLYSSRDPGQEQVPSSMGASQTDLSPLPPRDVIHSWILPLTKLAPKMVCLHHHSTIPHKNSQFGFLSSKTSAQNHSRFLAPQWAWVNNYVTAVLQLFIQITIQYFLNKSE